MTIPDCIGYFLGEARGILRKAGVEIDSIKVTSPPRNTDKMFDDTYRIVQQCTLKPNTVELLICKPL